jgi:hypothetical protein
VGLIWRRGSSGAGADVAALNSVAWVAQAQGILALNTKDYRVY